jgi:hypothetical protein
MIEIMKKREIPLELQFIFDQAVKNEQGTPPRKHHLVPASYLRRWTEDRKIRVCVVDEKRSYLSAPESAARETDYYRIEHPDVDPEDLPPLLLETTLGQLEGNAKRVIDDLLAHRNPARIAPQQLLEFAWHMAFTITRGKAFRDEIKELCADIHRMRYEKYTDDHIRAQLREHGITPIAEEVAKHRDFLDKVVAGEIVAEPHAVQILGHAGQSASELGKYLINRRWVVYETPPILVTCDEPVVLIGGPGSPRSERSGVAVAGVIIYPLSPSALLAMFHPGITPAPSVILDHTETAELNREIIAAATRWAFERPSRHITERMPVPPAPPKAFLREGPLPQVDGAEGDLYRSYKPTRWTSEDAPPWPVARWWPDGWVAQQFPRLDDLPPGAKIAIAGKQAPRGKRKPQRHNRRQ